MSNIQYFLEASRQERQELQALHFTCARSLGEWIVAVATKGKQFQSEQIEAIRHLHFANLLVPEQLPTENTGYILATTLDTETYRAVLVCPPLPFASFALMPVPDGPEWHNVPEITRYRLHELVESRIRQLDDELARLEALAKRDLPEECTRQRKEFDSLRQHLAECRTLSLMRNFTLSRDTMENLASLDVHIKAELAIKATGNN